MLSVVVTLVDGGAALRRCLQALIAQVDPPPMEIIVPYDATASSAAGIVAETAAGPGGQRVIGLDLGSLPTRRAPLSVAGQHELYDRRRAQGLAAARGEIVAILEDRGVPRPDWAAAAVSAHRRSPHLVIGGAVENGVDRVLNWAVFFCDFGRYRPPFTAGPRRYVTDVNVAYKRDALERTRHIWSGRYHEPLVHWALEEAGQTLLLTPEIVVEQQRDGLTIRSALLERLSWGRLFGALRVRDAPLSRRLALLAAAPAVPAILFWRVFRDQAVRRPLRRKATAAIPVVLVLQIAWVLGEAIGYATRES